MSEYADDAEWMVHVSTITDPLELLRELVELEDEVAGIGDPYYRDLYEAVINRARELSREPGEEG